MAANNQAIEHYGPQGRAYCGRMDAHIVVRESMRFDASTRKCRRCEAKLTEARKHTAAAKWRPGAGITQGF